VNGSSPRWIVATLLAVVSGSACSSATARVGDPPTATPPSAAAVTPTAHPADVHFMTAMIHHHAQALEMARLATENGASQSIQTLSGRITVAQTDEIEMIQLWLRDHGEEAPEPTPTGTRMVMNGAEHVMLMPGMLTEEQFAALGRARGSEFDRLFLAYMIQHHDGALKMVEDLFATPGGGIDNFIYKFASDTFADQGSEMDRMQTMLEALQPAR